MTEVHRSRPAYAIAFVAIVLLGLGSRRFGAHLPALVAAYGGDTLWAAMVFVGLGILAPRTGTRTLAGVALAIAYGDEISQLYHAPWIDAVRHTTLGGLVLGFGFLWSDIVCYTIGIAAAAFVERAVRDGRAPR